MLYISLTGGSVVELGAQRNKANGDAAMSKPDTTASEWAKIMAALAVDALVHAGLVPKAEFEAACEIVAEEINVRLCLNDYPPSVDHSSD